jgi:hypothetical protein
MGETLRSSNVETAYSCALHTSFSVRSGGATEKARVTGETPEPPPREAGAEPSWKLALHQSIKDSYAASEAGLLDFKLLQQEKQEEERTM